MDTRYIDIPLILRISVAPAAPAEIEYNVTPPHMRGVTSANAATDAIADKPTETSPSEPATASKMTTPKAER